MERRLLVAILLTFIVLTVYQYLVPTQPPPAATTQSTQAGAKPSTAAPTAAEPKSAASASAESEALLPTVATLKGDTAERTITVDNGVVRATFSNRGATLRSWQLTKYEGTSGQAIDLIPQDLPGEHPKPFSLRLPDAGKTARLNAALFATDQGGTLSANLEARNAPVTVRFEYQDEAGLQARKEFRIEPNSYVIAFSANVTDGTNTVNPTVQWGPGLGDVLALAGRGSFGTPVRRSEAIYSAGRKVQRLHADALQKEPRYQSSYEFAGVDTHYFISTAIQPGNAELEYHPLSIPGDGSSTREYVGYDIKFTSASNGPSNARFFFGPKHFETLKATDPDLVRAIWFGMFSFLSVPLLSALNWVHGYIGNYGWAIIALTFIINAAMFPLRHKSFVSMRKMQAIQPQVKAIQDRYAKLKVTDPARQKMNTELMDLYRQKGVNPASGCIPMLLTFPVLFAFYGLLSEAIELRGAPFIFWIKDLAAADPYYVTPILMGASQVLQQRMTPMTGADPVQQKMMLFMPVLFTFLFITSPSGLALYWFASNVLVICQQLITMRLIGGPERAKA